MPALLPLYETLDPDTYGGAILLGVDGVCIIAHGSSTPGDRQRHPRRREMVERDVVERDPRRRRRQRLTARPRVSRSANCRSVHGHSTALFVPAETHVDQGPLGREEIFEIVRDRLADILEIEPSTITEGQSFVDDLDADSLALIELVEALEEELAERTVGFRIEDEDLEDLKTVRDAVDYVHERDAEPFLKGRVTRR